MREIRLSGSEGGGTGNSTGPPYPYRTKIHQECTRSRKNYVKTGSYGAKNGARNGTAALSGRISGPLQYQEDKSFRDGEADGIGNGEFFSTRDVFEEV